MNTLRTQLTVIFTFLMILVLLLFGLLFNGTVDKMFATYANEQREKQIQQIKEQIGDLYDPHQGISLSGLEVIGNAALQNGLIVHVQTLHGELDWDISVHKAQACQLALQHAEENMHSRYPSFDGSYTEHNIDILYGDTPIGYLTVGYYGPYALNDAELKLINTLNQMLLLLSIAFAVSATVVIYLLSKRITRPISQVVSSAEKIAQGEYGPHIDVRPRTKELSTLVYSVNEMSEALRLRDEQKRRMTADIAHELRTPLANLQSHAEAVLDGIWEPSPEMFEDYLEEVLRLRRIVDQLKELNELESIYQELNYESISVYELFDSVCSDFSLQFQHKGVSLLRSGFDGDISLYCDRDRIKQCLINLVSNALRATPSGGSVTLCSEIQQGQVQLSVVDTGIGMTQQDMSQMFERFYRADPSRNKHTGGMGIGLAITKAIVEAHGGTIKADSLRGEGTTVTMVFPG